MAGVDPALIRHFFGDKDTLFAAVVADPTVIFERLATFSLQGDQTIRIGQRVTDTYLGLWEQAQTAHPDGRRPVGNDREGGTDAARRARQQHSRARRRAH